MDTALYALLLGVRWRTLFAGVMLTRCGCMGVYYFDCLVCLWFANYCSLVLLGLFLYTLVAIVVLLTVVIVVGFLKLLWLHTFALLWGG